MTTPDGWTYDCRCPIHRLSLPCQLCATSPPTSYPAPFAPNPLTAVVASQQTIIDALTAEIARLKDEIAALTSPSAALEDK